MILLTVLFSAIGIALSAGGIWLLALGGSPYYLIAGLMFIVVGVTLKRRRVVANSVYALLLLGTMAWALWESGLNWWPLASRMGLWLVMAVPLLIFVRRQGVRANTLLLPVWAICGAIRLSPLAMEDSTAVKGTMANKVIDEDAIQALKGKTNGWLMVAVILGNAFHRRIK